MKVLIYLESNKLAPVGGPLGVGFQIKKVLEANGIDTIDFLEGDINKNSKESKQKKWLYKHKHLTKIVRSVRHIIEYNSMFNNPRNDSVLLNQYGIIHFHSTIDMYKQRESLKDYKGVIVVTSHSPIPLRQELFEASSSWFEREYFKTHENKFLEMDTFAFEKADYIVFPCEDAEEPYYLNWNEYKEIHNHRVDHYRYIPTGIGDIVIKKDCACVRTQFGIEDSDFVVCYAGRHNVVKGYDSLRRIGTRCLNELSDTKFLIAGKPGPLYGIDNPNWIEIGWTNEVHDIINSSDVFVLPNKFTYFDLIMIEVLAIGKIVVASRTGGNKFYEKNNLEGVFLYDTEDEAVELIKKIKNMDKDKRRILGNTNRAFYINNLTSKHFVNNYLKFISSIEGKNNEQF